MNIAVDTLIVASSIYLAVAIKHNYLMRHIIIISRNTMKNISKIILKIM